MRQVPRTILKREGMRTMKLSKDNPIQMAPIENLSHLVSFEGYGHEETAMAFVW